MDGTPFFWLGDTAWELFHRLNREDAEYYLKPDPSKGLLYVAWPSLVELQRGMPMEENLTKNQYGEYDPGLPDVSADANDYDYWDHVDL